jgi:hypothetical protein
VSKGDRRQAAVTARRDATVAASIDLFGTFHVECSRPHSLASGLRLVIGPTTIRQSELRFQMLYRAVVIMCTTLKFGNTFREI